MREGEPQLDSIEVGVEAANDPSYGVIQSAEVIDIMSGQPYTEPTPQVAVQEVVVEAPLELVPLEELSIKLEAQADAPQMVTEDTAVAVEQEQPLLSQYEAALQRYPNTAPKATEEVPLELVPMEESGVKPVIEQGEVVLAETAEAVKEKKEVGEDILNSYKEKFGINKEDLESIEGFADLSRGQQRQVLENLSQITIGKIHSEAIDGQAEEFNAKQKDAKFLGKVWNGLKNSVTKKFDVINREKKRASDIQNGGISEHKDALEQMTKGMKELGPAVKEAADGSLEVQFIETDGMSPEVARVAEAFNEQGTKLSKVPYEWSLDSASAEQKKAYSEAKETYELQRAVLLEQMKKEGGDEKAVKAMAQTESVIEMQRFIQTCPDAAKGLEDIKDQNAWTAALGSVATERGLYMAGGALARTALGAVIGLAAAPAAAALIGGIRGWKRAGDALVAEDVAQRKGEVVPETEAVKQAKSRIGEINIALANASDERIKAELSTELTRLNKSVRGTTKNMVAAFNESDIAGDKEAESGDRRRGATAKLEYLKAQIASIDEQLASGPAADEAGNLAEKKAKLAAQLDRRVNYTKMKVSEGKMVFGAEGERLGNQYALMRSMAEAEAVLSTETAVDENGDKAERRLAKMLSATDEQINDARFKKKLGQAVKAGTIGGVLAGVGVAAADAVKWMNGATDTFAEKAFGDIGSVKQEAGEIFSAVKDSAQEIAGEAAGAIAAIGTKLGVAGTEMPINGLDLPPNYVFPVQEAPINGLDIPPDYQFPPVESVPAHTVSAGENLSTIFAREIPGSTNQEVIATLRSLSPAELKALGVESGNIDMIHPGDKIDIGKMREYLAFKTSGSSTVTEVIKTGGGGGGGSGGGVSGGGTMGSGEASVVIPTAPEQELPDDTGAGDILGTAEEIGSLKMQATPGVFRIGEMTRTQIEAWDKDLPLPGPVDEVEATRVFGESGKSGMRALAEKMKLTLGRYPNEDEADMYEDIRLLHPKEAGEMVKTMSSRPMSYNEMNTIVEKAKWGKVSTTEAVLPPKALVQAEVVATPKVTLPPPPPPYGVELPSTIPGPKVLGQEVAMSPLSPAEAAKVERIAAINLEEQQRIQVLEAAHKSNLAKLARSQAEIEQTRNASTINRGVAQIIGRASGNKTNLGDFAKQELLSRTQSGVNNAAMNQKIIEAQIANHNAVIASTHASYEQMRRGVIGQQVTQVPRPAAVAPRMEVGDAPRVVSPLNIPPTTRPSEVLGQAPQPEKIITGEVKAGGETAYARAVAQQAEINKQLPAELLTKELPRAEVVQLMGGKSVAEVRELGKLSGNVNVLELNKTLDAIQESRFVAKPNESVGDFVGRFNAYQGRFGAFARGASPQGSVDQDFWPKAYSLTPEQLASDTTLNPSLRGPLSGALGEAMKRGFQAKPGENIGDFLNRYDKSFR